MSGLKNMEPLLEKRPDFRKLEEEILKFWNREQIYRFNPNAKKPVYSIDTPPPTISGNLHVGHVFSYSQQEFIARYKRMRGYNVYYPFGFDNNGLPTERLAEKVNNVRAKDMPRKEFVKLCLETSRKFEQEYERVFKRIGISCDWNECYRTIAPEVQKISQLSFIRLYKKGRIYRKLAPTLWCPKCETAVAQVELEDREQESTFNHILFELEDGSKIEIATTRPELLASCLAIFVHPKDKRYKHLIGKKAKVPLFWHKVPIIADEHVDMKKGTGIVMFCTFGDLQDVDWYLAYNFEARISITSDGRLNKLAGKYAGMSIKEARKTIIEDLHKEGLLVKQEPIKHIVNVHERCGTEIEFLLTEQWFLRYLDLKKEFLNAGRQIKWWPRHMRVRYDNWVKGLRWDWCLSRQRFFGVPFPVWYCKKCGKVILPSKSELPVDPLSDKPKTACSCGSKEFEPEKDVMDTWATSALTPLINARWDKGTKHKRFKMLYPMSLRPNAHDIITFWDFNTIAMCLLHTGKVPFENIMISGHGLDPHGRKMSKSKGNVVLPLDVVARYSADALRYWAASVKLGEDLNFREEDLRQGLRFTTKLWNTARFASIFLHEKPKKPKRLHIIDAWLLSELSEVVKACTKAFERYEYSKAKSIAEQFFWSTFCDYYLEMIKYRLYSENSKWKGSANYALYIALLTLLKLFAPFVPFVTEAIYQKLFRKFEQDKSIHVSAWPEKVARKSKYALEVGRTAKEAIAAIRKWKKLKNMSLAEEVEKLKLFCPKPKLANEAKETIASTMRIKELVIEKAQSFEASDMQ